MRWRFRPVRSVGATLAGPTRSSDLTLAFELPGLEVSLVRGSDLSCVSKIEICLVRRKSIAALVAQRPPQQSCRLALPFAN